MSSSCTVTVETGFPCRITILKSEGEGTGALIPGRRLFPILAARVGAYSGEGSY